MSSGKRAGMWTSGASSDPPASRSRTRTVGSSVSRFASTQPALPAPTMTKSKDSDPDMAVLPFVVGFVGSVQKEVSKDEYACRMAGDGKLPSQGAGGRQA